MRVLHALTLEGLSQRPWPVLALVAGGGFLLLVSAIPLYFQLQEAALGWIAYNRYEVTPIDGLQASVNCSTAVFSDKFLDVEEPTGSSTRWVPLEIWIDGADWSIPALFESTSQRKVQDATFIGLLSREFMIEGNGFGFL